MLLAFDQSYCRRVSIILKSTHTHRLLENLCSRFMKMATNMYESLTGIMFVYDELDV